MEFLLEYGLFLAKSVTVVIAVVIIIGALFSAGQRNKTPHSGHITVMDLGEDLKDLEDGVRKETLSKEAYKSYHKAQKQAEKEKTKQLKREQKKAEKTEPAPTVHDKRLFVIEFDGDVEASAVENLREEITAVLTVADEKDEVLLKLESPGGMVHTYGLAASQLQRLKQRGLTLNIAVDAVAASGGYMMACVGNKILAAPFAIIGSIGVLGQIPNFNRLLKHNNIDFEQHTAGEFKRTLTMFGENTDKAREKFRDELEITHNLFKSFIKENRSELDIDKVATGEHWYGSQALDLGLVDEITTSDDFVLNWSKNNPVFQIKYEIKKPLSERLPISLLSSVQKQFTNLWYKNETQNLYK